MTMPSRILALAIDFRSPDDLRVSRSSAHGDHVARVGAVMRNRPDTPILIKADRSVPYGNVVGAMVLLQQGGADAVGFVTDPLDTYPIPE